MGARAGIVAGDRVVLTSPDRDEFVERWRLFDDPLLTMLLGAPTAAPGAHVRTMPPASRQHREALYEEHVARRILCFDVREGDPGGRCVAEAYLADLAWPRASGELCVVVLAPEDRGKGFGSEAAILLCAYAFDGLGLNRVCGRFPVDNRGAGAALERHGAGVGARVVGVERESEWVFGRHADVTLWEVLRGEFPPHPATADLRTPPSELPG